MSSVLYGFVELDVIRDSTQSFQEPMGNGAIARRDTLAGSASRLMLGARHSRLGYKVKSPEREGFRASGLLEMDFVGNQPANPPALSEAAFFGNPTFRFRHYALKIETEFVDFLFGQSWQLFGWQGSAHPNTVQIQGLPGQIYSRAAQVRVSHVFKTESFGVELAVAAARHPPARRRDADKPGRPAGAVSNWKGAHGGRDRHGSGSAVHRSIGRRAPLHVAGAPGGPGGANHGRLAWAYRSMRCCP